MHEYLFPVTRKFLWYQEGVARLEELPAAGWRKLAATVLLRALKALGVVVIENHDMRSYTRMERFRAELPTEYLYKISDQLRAMSEEPWFVMVNYKVFHDLQAMADKGQWFPPLFQFYNPEPFAVHYGMPIRRGLNLEFVIAGTALPIIVSRFLNEKDFIIVPRVRGSEKFQPFHWLVREIRDRVESRGYADKKDCNER